MRGVSADAGRAAEWHPWLASYWLCHSECFRVDSAEGGHVGFVEEVLWSPDESVVEALIVRATTDAGRTLIVPIEDVVEVCPEASRLVARVPARSRARRRPATAAA